MIINVNDLKLSSYDIKTAFDPERIKLSIKYKVPIFMRAYYLNDERLNIDFVALDSIFDSLEDVEKVLKNKAFL